MNYPGWKEERKKRKERKKKKKKKKKKSGEEQMRVSRLAKSWNTLVAIRSKILSKLSFLLSLSLSLSLSPPPFFLHSFYRIRSDYLRRFFRLFLKTFDLEENFADFEKKERSISERSIRRTRKEYFFFNFLIRIIFNFSYFSRLFFSLVSRRRTGFTFGERTRRKVICLPKR